jgi:hypothetical protein
MANFIKSLSSATSGTITLPDTQQNVIFIHDAASLAVTLTIVMPATPVDGQQVTIISRLGVTTLTMTSTPTVVGLLSVLTAAIPARFIYESSNNKWYPI